MDAGSCLSESGVTNYHQRLGFGLGRRSIDFLKESQELKSPNLIRSPSASSTAPLVDNKAQEEKTTTTNSNKPRMAHLQTLEAKMANIEVSLCNSAPRRRKSSSGGGSASVISASASVRSSPCTRTSDSGISSSSPAKEIRTALQDREAVIQNLRVQLGLGKLPRPSGTPLEESEKPAAEQRLHRLKVDAENKRIAIRNLKSALDKLDITDNIDVRIRQAELEYALGREELQLLSLVEEAQALQSRFDKAKVDAGTIFSALQSGANLSLVAVTAHVGKWAATPKAEGNGLWVEWALEGEGLYRGDRLLEVNGILVSSATRDDLPKILGTSGKCQLVVLRRKVQPGQHQQLIQTQEDNMRLQHRISYLEEQVKELLENKENPQPLMLNSHHHQHPSSEKSPHVTSINITSPPVTPPDKPEVFQRGNFIMTIVGGKPVKKPTPIPLSSSSASSASSASSVSSQHRDVVKGDQVTKQQQQQQKQQESRHESRTHTYERNNSHGGFAQRSHYQQHQQLPPSSSSSAAGQQQRHQQQQQQQQQMHGVSRSISASSISINSEAAVASSRREKERREREKELRREIRDRFIYKSRSGHRLDAASNGGTPNNGLAYSKSGDQLHLTSNGDKRREMLLEMSRRNAAHTINELSRSVKSLDFDSDYGGGGGCATEPRKSSRNHYYQNSHNVSKDNLLDYASDSMGPMGGNRYNRPMPPKKPLRLSLQRAQSLQTVDGGSLTDIDSRKKCMKRSHRGVRPPPDVVQFTETASREQLMNGSASLGRMKYV